MNKRTSILAGAAVLATSLAPLASVSAFSPAVHPDSGSVYTIIREISGVNTITTNTFTYTITPDSNNPAEVTGLPTPTIAFTNVNPAATISQSTDIDFSTVNFTKVGDYYFTITETGSTNTANYPLSTDSYTAYVSVRNTTNADGSLSGSHVAVLGTPKVTGGSKVNDYTGSDSEVIFDGGVTRTYVEIAKTVAGNDADEDECFAFDVTFTYAASVGVNYALSTASTCTGNPSSVSGNGTTTIYLKHNDTATIGVNSATNPATYEVPIGSTWSVKENGAATYNTYFDGSDTISTNKTSATKTTVTVGDTNFNTNNKIAVKNSKESTPETGVIFSILPFIIIALIGIFGAAYVAKTKKVTE